jgi:hypothetical protein
MKYYLSIAVALVVLYGLNAQAQDDDVKYCKDFETGEIIVVEAGMPCPGTTAEL